MFDMVTPPEDIRMKNITLTLSVAAVMLAGQAFGAANFSVAPGGSDANPGTEAKPWGTLQRARDEIRKRKRAGPLKESISIVLRGGTYYVGQGLVLGPEDSGTDTAPVVWQASPGEEARLCGGVRLAPGSFHPVAGAKVLARLDPAARPKVLQADLRALGIKQLGEYPDVFRGAPAVPEVFFNDQRLTLARWPNDGWATIAKIIEPGSRPADGDRLGRGGVFQYSGDRPTRWNVAAGVWLRGYWCYDWYEEAIRVKAIDRAARRATLARPAVYGVKQGNPSPRRYYAVNLLEELDAPGEYYIDRASGSLLLWPPAELRSARIVVSTLRAPVVLLKDAAHVTIRGLIVEDCLGNGIEVSGGSHNLVQACTVRNARELGIHVRGGTAHRVEACAIHDTGTGGLVLEGGDRRTLTPAGHQAVNNHIWRFSQHVLSYACGITLKGVGNRAAHNRIHDAPHIAVAIDGNDHLFEYNLVHDVCTASDDAGGLYKGRNPSCRGNVIRYNFWRDVGSPMGHGTAAVYFDDGDGGDTVDGNVFLRCGHPGRGSFGTIFSHGGHDNSAENNIFIECRRALGSAPWGDRRWKEALDGGLGCDWQNRLLKEVDITKPPYTTRYPSLVGFMNPQAGQARVNRAKNNVLVRCGEVSNGNWRFRPEEMWSTDGDPGFVDVAKGNFQLRPDAEVFRRLPGFRPIPFDKIGPQADPPRPSKP